MMNYALVYLPIKPEIAKKQNLPLKLPVLADDLQTISELDQIPLDIILRGLRAQWKAKKDAYYSSYLRFFVFEKFKETLKANEFEHSGKLLSESLKYGKEDYLYHFYNGLLLKKIGDFGNAEAELRKAASMNTASPMITFELGQLLFDLDDLDNSLEEFTKTLERDRRFIPAYVACGDVFHRVGDYNGALGFYKKAIEAAPDFIPPFVRLGVVYNKKGNFEKAKVYFEKGLKKDADNFELNYNIAFTYMRLKKPLLSIKHLKKCLEINPDMPSVYNELGIINKNLGFFKEAQRLLEAGLKKGESATVKWHLIQVYSLLGKYSDAKKLLKELSSDEVSLNTSDYLNILNSEEVSERDGFSLRGFSSWVLNNYDDMDEELKDRLISLSTGTEPEIDLSREFNLDPLPLAIEILTVYENLNISLFKALTLFSTYVCNCVDWIVFSRFLFIVVNEMLFMGEDEVELSLIMERIADEIMDLDWALSQWLVRADKEMFKDVQELVETSATEKKQIEDNQKDVIILIMNILWVEPTQSELRNILKAYNHSEEIEELCLFLLNRQNRILEGE